MADEVSEVRLVGDINDELVDYYGLDYYSNG